MGRRRSKDEYQGSSFTNAIPLTDIDDTFDARVKAEDARNRAAALTGGMLKENLFDPTMEEGVTRSETVAAPPGAIAAQQRALADMAAYSQGAGGAQEAAAMRAMQGAAGRQQAGAARQAAAQGQGSGMGAASTRIGALQGLYDGTGAAGTAAELEAKRRGMGAMKQRAQMAASMRRQSFAESKYRARAGDERSQYNTNNRRAIVGRNVDRNNRTSEQLAGQYVGGANSADANDERQKQAQADAEAGLLEIFG